MKNTTALTILVLSGLAIAQEEFKNLEILPKDIKRPQLMKIMRTWSGDLGVRCSHCHWGPTDKFKDLVFESEKKETKKTAREMYRMVTRINRNFFEKRDNQISCYTCHHGTSDPRKLDDILLEAYAEGGITRVDQTYRALRKRYHGMGAYNFGPWAGLTTLAGELFAQERYGDMKLVHQLNLEFNPGFDGSHSALGSYYIFVETNLEKARFHFDKSMAGNAFWTRRRMLELAKQLQKKAMTEESLTTLELLIEIAPNHAEGHFQYGNGLREAGKPDAARKAFQRALEIKPDHEGAAKALADL